MQDAYLKLWERWGRVSLMDDPTGFLFRTAMNLVRAGTGGQRSPSAGRSRSRRSMTLPRSRIATRSYASWVPRRVSRRGHVPSERTVTVGVGHGKKAARHIDAWLTGTPPAVTQKHPPATFEMLNPWFFGVCGLQAAARARAR